LDLITRYTDTIPDHNVDSYIDLDLRLGWRPNQRLGVALIAQNLLDSSRPEFPGPFTGALATENKRGIYAQMTWRY
ncbi:MAG: iron complex outermembrane receptor protein, partial [Mariniblastus sp.]